MSKTARSEGGAFFQVRVGTPRMSSSSISKSWPGAVSAALASAMDMDGASLLAAHSASFSVVPAWSKIAAR